LDFTTGYEPIKRYYQIAESGVYYYLIINCGDELQNPKGAYIDGKVSFRNPYGYIDGDEYGYFPFYIVLMILYGLLAIVWSVPVYKYRKIIVNIQHCLSFLIIVGFLDCSFYLVNWLYYNANGTISYPFVLLSSGLNTVKMTLSRLVLLAVCLGYGIGSLEIQKKTLIFMALFGVCYTSFSWTASFLDEIQDKTVTPVPGYYAIFLFLPLMTLETVMYCWIGMALTRTMTLLYRRKEEIKLSMYKYLAVVLACAIFLSAIVAVIEMIALMLGKADDWWKGWWVWDAYWQILYFSLLCSICYLWRPTGDNDKYSYKQISTDPKEAEANNNDDDDDEEDIEMKEMATGIGIEIGKESSGDNKGSDDKGKAGEGGVDVSVIDMRKISTPMHEVPLDNDSDEEHSGKSSKQTPNVTEV